MKITNPEACGFSPERLAKIDAVMQGFLNQGKAAGILNLVARGGQVVYLKAFGMMDIASQRPMREDAIFRIYSMTKPVTSAAAMMLFEENGFHLDDPLSRFLPAFKHMKVITGMDGKQPILEDARREIIISDLFTHSAGMSYGFMDDDYLDSLYRSQMWLKFETGHDLALDEVTDVVAQFPLRFHPGSAYNYSVSIDILGRLVEVISGMPFDRFLQERIFTPLGMLDTAFWVPPEKIHRLATNYGPDEKNPGMLKDIDPVEKSSYARPVKFLSGGGGLVSTIGDYLRFCQMLLNKGQLDGVRLLGRKTVELMFMNHLAPGVFMNQNPGFGFGLGGSVVLDPAQTHMLGSRGTWAWGGAANTKFWIDPQEELIGIMMLQFMPDTLFISEADFRNPVYQALVD
jgi:CubicO group peptidase (beta-lactamase class C family)